MGIPYKNKITTKILNGRFNMSHRMRELPDGHAERAHFPSLRNAGGKSDQHQ